MHHIYRTRAVVLSSQDLKEADKQLVVLTEDFGLLKVIAQGTRKMESKLRPSIQDFSFVNVALVSGRAGWRLTNASLIYSIPEKLKNKNLLQSLARTFNLIERLVLGESEDNLFSTLSDFVEFMIENQNKILHINQLKNLESVFVANVLNQLGYFDTVYLEKINNKKLSIELINSIDDNEIREINKIINQSIRESGL